MDSELRNEHHNEHHSEFLKPPLKFAPRPLWFWNETAVTRSEIQLQMQAARDRCGFGGFGIVPFGEGFEPEYLSEDYFTAYAEALKKAQALGMTMCIYDEYGYPSGSAGAIHGDGIPRFANRHPEHTIKRLDKIEEHVEGPVDARVRVPTPGCLMSAVAMEKQTKQLVDLRPYANEHEVRWTVPSGSWKVMIFVCVIDGDPIVDYLNPDSVAHFVEMTHQEYYNRFHDLFGNTINGTFNDEPTMYRAGGRMWTEAFNTKFLDKHGFDPAMLYPALWYDIGSQTAAARNYLFGFRSELYATGFPKVIQDWSEEHGIEAMGHQDQEEMVNPVGISGDLMLCFKHLGIPGIDKIGGNRPAERFYKVISSAAYNWDKPIVMSETFGAMGDISWELIYQITLEQYTKGINALIPHAVWFDDQNVLYKPELSWRHEQYADGLPAYSEFVGRLNVMLQNEGRHVADIAVLYPIADLQAKHYLDGPLGFYDGGVSIPEADYVVIGELLSTEICRDFTYLHPEVLDAKCSVDAGLLLLENEVNFEKFKVVIVPLHDTIRWSNLEKLKAFYDSGGSVIATGSLPTRSAEFGCDASVQETIVAMFPDIDGSSQNENGGTAMFIGKVTANNLRKALDETRTVWDVMFDVGSELRYIHKFREGRDIFYFANLSDHVIDGKVEFRGMLTPEAWDPHTGRISALQYDLATKSGCDITRIDLRLAPNTSLFVVGK